VQALTEKLSRIAPGRLQTSSLVYTFIDTQLEGLLRPNVRGVQYGNKMLHFSTALYRTIGGAGYRFLRGTPVQPQPRGPPGGGRQRCKLVGNRRTTFNPTDYNLLVPSVETINTLVSDCSSFSEGVGTPEHVEAIVQSLEAELKLSRSELATLVANDPRRIALTGILTFDKMQISEGVVRSAAKEAETGNPLVGFVTGHEPGATSTREDTATGAFEVQFASLTGKTRAFGTIFLRNEDSEPLAKALQAAIERLIGSGIGIDVIGGCADGAKVMKKTLQRLRKNAKRKGRAFFLSIDFDHTTKNIRNMLLNYILTCLRAEGRGAPFSMLTIRRLAWSDDPLIRSRFEHLQPQALSPINRMTSSLAVDVIGPLTTAAMQSILDDYAHLADDAFVSKIGECRHSIRESLEYCTKASKADRGWRDSELTEAVVAAYEELSAYAENGAGSSARPASSDPFDVDDDDDDDGDVDVDDDGVDDDDDDDVRGDGDSSVTALVDFHNLDDDELTKLCKGFEIELPTGAFSRTEAVGRLQALLTSGEGGPVTFTGPSTQQGPLDLIGTPMESEAEAEAAERRRGVGKYFADDDDDDSGECIVDGDDDLESTPHGADSGLVMSAGAETEPHSAKVAAEDEASSDRGVGTQQQAAERSAKPKKQPAKQLCDGCKGTRRGRTAVHGSLYRKTEGGLRELCRACFVSLVPDAQQHYTQIALPPSKPPAWCDVCVEHDANCKAIRGTRYHRVGEDFDLCEAHYLDESNRGTSGAGAPEYVTVEPARGRAGAWISAETRQAIRWNAAFLRHLLDYVQTRGWDIAKVDLLTLSTLGVEQRFGRVRMCGQSKPNMADYVRFSRNAREQERTALLSIVHRWNMRKPFRGANSCVEQAVGVIDAPLHVFTRRGGAGSRRGGKRSLLPPAEQAVHTELLARLQRQIKAEGAKRTLSQMANQSNFGSTFPCTAEARPPGVRVERRDLLRSVLGLRVAVYWLAESVSEDMSVRLEKGHWWHGEVVEEAAGDRTTLSVKYDDADEPGADKSVEHDVVNITDENVVWLRRPTRTDA